MRPIGKFKDEQKAEIFSKFLLSQGIENQRDDSEEGKKDEYQVWVVDEDQYENAVHWLSLYESDEDNPLFKKIHIAPISPFLEDNQEIEVKPKGKEPRYPLTYGILMLCTLLFLSSSMEIPSIQKIPKNVPLTPVLMPPVAKSLLYDYPKAWEYIDQLVKEFGINSLESPQDLPSEGKLLLYQFYNTPYWQGFYDKVIGRIKNNVPSENQASAPLFEKIRQGEVWRLFTPCLLHFDLFHIFFNMIWLIVLGRQIENKIGGFKYLLFILLTGIFSNTAQYLMSGPNFIGYSGIVMAMIGFIFARQSSAAWEGYQLTRSTLLFVFIFIGSILFLQLISFFIDVAGYTGFSPPIANTAHIAGAIAGYFLGKLPFFAWKAV